MENKNLQLEFQKLLRSDERPVSIDEQTTPTASGEFEPASLQMLAQKIELCIEKQKKLNFITKEISDIIKRSY